MVRFAILALTLLLAGCAQYSMVGPQRVTVQHALSTEPDIAWNKLNASADGTASQGPVEIWTADGNLLDTITFFAGIEDGKPLIARRESEEKLPPFRRAMTASDVMELVEASFAKTSQSPLTKARNLRPAPFGGVPGFRFEFTLVGKDEVDREALAAGAVHNGKLYLIVYQGTRLYHYGLRLAHAERIIDSVRFTGG